jgi:aspartate kinase
MQADICEIYTDVDGVYSADPRIVPNAKLLETITYEEMLEMAACGAKVLHLRAVEYARREGVPLRVRSSYTDQPGTTIVGSIEELSVEQAVLTGVAHDRSEAKVTVVGVPDQPGFAARIFRAVADVDINIDMVLQNVSHLQTGKTDVTFTLPVKDGPKAVAALGAVQVEVGHEEVLFDEHVGKVTLVGAGMRSHPGVTATFCESLAEAGVNIEMMNTSEIRISALIRDTQLDDAVRALHEAFDLGGDTDAVVHAGTGR